MKIDLSIDNPTLIEMCRKGDKEALSLFYTRFAPKMSGVIRRYVGNPSDAEDILHDGFIVAFTRLDSLHDSSKVEYWIASIMRNLSLKFLENQDLTSVLDELPEIDDTPEMDEFIDLETLERLICKLPEGYQKVFRLAVLENKSHKEIGTMLGISPGTSSSQLFHARMLMRKIIGDYKRNPTLLAIIIILLIGGGMLLKRNVDNVDTLQFSISDEDILCSDKNELPDEQLPSNEKDSMINGKASGKKAFMALSTTSQVCEIPMDKDPAGAVGSTDSISQNQKDETTDVFIEQEQLPSVVCQYKEESLPNFSQRKQKLSVSVGINAVNFVNPASSLEINNYWWGGEPCEDNPNLKEEERGKQTITRAIDNSDYYTSLSHHNHFPVRVTASLSKQLNDKFSIDGRVNYTYLHTTFYSKLTVDEARWHYIGIGANLNIRCFSSGRFFFYGSGGISFEIPVSSRVECSYRNGTLLPISKSFKSSSTWTLSASYGVEFKISDAIGIYVEPTFDYHIQPKPLVPNYWTDNAASFSLPIGLRFKW